MQLILLEKIANLGNLGDKVNVKAGYGRNYLLPFGKATAVEVQKSEVRLPNGTIRNVGEFDVAVHLHAEVEATVRVVVVAA